MISIVILTKNNARTLAQTLESTKTFPEVIILDNGSTDATLTIAKKYPHVQIHTSSSFEGFGVMKNLAASYAKYDWILSLDGDEVISDALAKEIHALSLQETFTYEIPFINYYNGKQIKCCGWYPESHIRLYNKKNTQFDKTFVHEAIVTTKQNIIKLQSPIYHFSYLCTEDFLRKLQLYTSLFAKQNQGKKKSSITKALVHGIFAFLKSFILKKGFLGGKEGLLISIYQANTAFYKYIKLFEKNQKL